VDCRQTATLERTFPLYDLLARQPPDFKEDGTVLYSAANNPGINVDKLKHFALGMFWKASVDSWSGTATDPRIVLGPYSERIRTWLRGDSEFPQHIFLVVVVSPPLRAQIALIDPYEAERQECRSFFLNVPGILFMLNVGKQWTSQCSCCVSTTILTIRLRFPRNSREVLSS
jgi:hypothetical protein